MLGNSMKEAFGSLDAFLFRSYECECRYNPNRLVPSPSVMSLMSHLSVAQEEAEWPSFHSLQTEPQQQQAFALRETSKDSGIHEMTEEKRRSAKRKE